MDKERIICRWRWSRVWYYHHNEDDASNGSQYSRLSVFQLFSCSFSSLYVTFAPARRLRFLYQRDCVPSISADLFFIRIRVLTTAFLCYTRTLMTSSKNDKSDQFGVWGSGVVAHRSMSSYRVEWLWTTNP